MSSRTAFLSITMEDPSWTVKEASDSFSQLFNSAFAEPQVVAHRDGRKAVMVSIDNYNALTQRQSTLLGTLLQMRHDPALESALVEPEPYSDLVLE